MITARPWIPCLLASLVAACAPAVPAAPTYLEDVAPILLANCARCHGAPSALPELRNCLRVDTWDNTADVDGVCAEDQPTTLEPALRLDVIAGVRDSAPRIVQTVLDGTMPKDGPPLTTRQQELLARWRDAGFPRRATNAPPAITFLTPPPEGATVDQTYDVQVEVADPDGDPVSWSLGWTSATRTGTFATGLREGASTVAIDTSILASGPHDLVAMLDDGTEQVTETRAAALIVPAGRNARPTVVVTEPNGGASYYPSQTVTVTWLADDDADGLTADVVALGGPQPLTIATGVATTRGQPTSTPWSLAPVPAGSYQIEVTVRDSATPGLTGTDASDAPFTVTAPPADVSFAAQVLPIFDASCDSAACHGTAMPQEGLRLTPGAAYAALVDVPSAQCPGTRLVQPGAPDQSYLVHKLQGSGPCFMGTRMPRGMDLTPAQLQLVRDWIANGAPNN